MLFEFALGFGLDALEGARLLQGEVEEFDVRVSGTVADELVHVCAQA